MELETLAENADFDDVDDNDFGEELGGDDIGGEELGGEEPKLDISRLSIENDLVMTYEPEVNQESIKEDIDNTGVELEVKDVQKSVELEGNEEMEEEKTDSAKWNTSDLLPEGWKFKEVEGNVQLSCDL